MSGPAASAPAAWDDLESLLQRLEDHQRSKVVALARRLRPDLTLDDLQSPHDFPELHDPDWHYEDGVLTGIQTVAAAIRAKLREQHG